MKIVDINPVKEGKFLNFYHYKLDNGKDYEVVSRRKVDMDSIYFSYSDAVDIIVFDSIGEKMLVIREWRAPVGDYIFAFPAGLREPGETRLQTASRELFEETGLVISIIYDILEPAYQSPGMTNETVASIFCSAEGKIVNAHMSKNEDITPMWITKQQARQILREEKISGRCQMVLYLWTHDFFNVV